jgi:hypothetical protein
MMMSENLPLKPNTEQVEKKKFFSKSFWIATLISFGSLLIVCVLIGLIEYYAQGAGDISKKMLALSVDCVGLAGIIGFLVFLLSYVASHGAFDILNYSVQLLFVVIFRPNYRKTSFPKSFYDFKVLQDAKERKPLLALCFVSLLFIIVGFILLIMFNMTK